MRFLHSGSVIHFDLKPDNIVLGLRLECADHGFWAKYLTEQSGDSFIDSPQCNRRDVAHGLLLVCTRNYPNRSSHLNDLFSFGMILYELLTGRSIFSKDLTLNRIAFMIAIEHELLDIPEFVFPSARDLIMACPAEELGDWPCFEDIVDGLTEMKFKVMRNVNSSKLWEFVKVIEEWEVDNAAVPQ